MDAFKTQSQSSHWTLKTKTQQVTWYPDRQTSPLSSTSSSNLRIVGAQASNTHSSVRGTKRAQDNRSTVTHWAIKTWSQSIQTQIKWASCQWSSSLSKPLPWHRGASACRLPKDHKISCFQCPRARMDPLNQVIRSHWHTWTSKFNQLVIICCRNNRFQWSKVTMGWALIITTSAATSTIWVVDRTNSLSTEDASQPPAHMLNKSIHGRQWMVSNLTA